MGQISLPRLNRVGESMFWESAVYTELRPGLALKNYIILQYLTRYIFFYDFFYKLIFWQHSLSYSSLIVTSYKNMCISCIERFTARDTRSYTLKFYLYFYNNRAFIFLFYLDTLDFDLGRVTRKLRVRRRAGLYISAYL